MRSASCRRSARICAASRGRPFAAFCRQSIDSGENPRPLECKKLTGRDLFRVRVAVYRQIIYEVRDYEVMVVVVKVGHRRDVYDR